MSVINKLLIANRAEIAARVIRTARQMGIATAAVFSDADAALPYVSLADEAVHLPGGAATDTYLNIGALIRAAKSIGADAVHPGYGFLSENAEFAKSCEQAGLVFVGPGPETIASMGSKTRARELMAQAGVPVLPGRVVAGDRDLQEGDLDEALAEVGLPLLVKAAAGGGGRGMRLVEHKSELQLAVRSAQDEAAAAFGDSTVFLECYVQHPRHIEVQVLGDASGHVVALYERECSIQRRYQKLIEEAPSPFVDESLRSALCHAAITAAKTIGYQGAGTVEFVVGDDRSFYFLEVNTRLQVEHPVTEMVTGLDLVELQLRVAAGEAVADEVSDAPIRGHALEARLYAEDPLQDFMPASGTLYRFTIPEAPNVRIDAGYSEGSVVSTYYDAMLAKVIAWSPDRREAVRLLANALEAARVHGPVTNRELLVAVLRHPEFASARIDTGFLVRHPPYSLLGPSQSEELRRAQAIVAALAGSVHRLASRALHTAVRPGFRNVPSTSEHVVLRDPIGTLRIDYRWGRYPGQVEVRVDQIEQDVQAWELGLNRIELTVDGVRRSYEIHRVDDTTYVDTVSASSVWIEEPRFEEPSTLLAAGSLVAPLPGSVTRLEVKAGDEVAMGTVLVVLEAMKMQHQVHAPMSGRIAEVRVAQGDQVDRGQVLVVLEDAP